MRLCICLLCPLSSISHLAFALRPTTSVQWNSPGIHHRPFFSTFSTICTLQHPKSDRVQSIRLRSTTVSTASIDTPQVGSMLTFISSHQ
ncbi:hypothetical protein C8Q75DRAFT_759468 [Abortiporus biennis]|nr:hypothetical protein C8Q75DRAFT_759468 [Abortiporus biennis]